MIANFIIWNVRPQIIDFGSFELRYYSLLFVIAFILGYIILGKIFRKEGLPMELADKLTIYVVISTIIGARLGHCLFYEFGYYIQHPLEIILPWRGKLGEDFQFTGYQGLASHGAALGLFFGIYLFTRKSKKSYLWTLDKLAILIALAGAFIRTGNLMNSEIYGLPTNKNSGYMYVRDFTDLLYRIEENNISHIKYSKIQNDTNIIKGYAPLKIDIEFSGRVKSEEYVRNFAEYKLRDAILRLKYQNNVIHPRIDELKYKIEKSKRRFHIKGTLYGVPRHPTQIYEAVAYFLIFLLLLYLYQNKKLKFKEGFLFGVFMFTIFIARFIIEFLKENQEEFENSLPLNMGQILSIPFIIIGIIFIINKRRAKTEA
jgi:phosphatidylglycerol:prolipoprotein diacylglycerol transferase